jgi:hypothetical protein
MTDKPTDAVIYAAKGTQDKHGSIPSRPSLSSRTWRSPPTRATRPRAAQPRSIGALPQLATRKSPGRDALSPRTEALPAPRPEGSGIARTKRRTGGRLPAVLRLPKPFLGTSSFMDHIAEAQFPSSALSRVHIRCAQSPSQAPGGAETPGVPPHGRSTTLSNCIPYSDRCRASGVIEAARAGRCVSRSWGTRRHLTAVRFDRR